MRIAFTGLALPEGKSKYQDPIVVALTEKFEPKKVSPYFFEFMKDDYESAPAIAIARESILDLLIGDIERIENRLARAGDGGDGEAWLRPALAHLEAGQPLCDMAKTPEQDAAMKACALLSVKPTVLFDEAAPDPSALCKTVMERAGVMFFYTAGKEEVHAWLVPRGSDAVTCAGKIHTDLARGFIKADVVSVSDLLTVHSFNEARAKGLSKLVARDYTIEENTVLEIRFNV